MPGACGRRLLESAHEKAGTFPPQRGGMAAAEPAAELVNLSVGQWILLHQPHYSGAFSSLEEDNTFQV